MVARIIQTIIAPVVMITTCSIMLGAMMAHYAAINDRVRAMTREQFDLLRPPNPDAIAAERLEEIERQVPELLNRHKLMRNAILAIYCAVVFFVVDMFAIALSALWDTSGAATAVLIVFLIGITAMLVGVVLTVNEIRLSHHAIEYEARRVLMFKKNRGIE
jgi:hypothetical protein